VPYLALAMGRNMQEPGAFVGPHAMPPIIWKLAATLAALLISSSKSASIATERLMLPASHDAKCFSHIDLEFQDRP